MRGIAAGMIRRRRVDEAGDQGNGTDEVIAASIIFGFPGVMRPSIRHSRGAQPQ
jgi:hypothetical protein